MPVHTFLARIIRFEALSMSVCIPLACLLLLASTYSFPQTAPAAFDGVEKWKDLLNLAPSDFAYNLKR
jgi:hypothetical protein